MSLYGMMRTGVSGMNAQANRLSTVADNIANSGTTGYKRSSTEFSSLIIPSTTGNYTSGGVTTTIRTSISQQGDLKYTSSGSDLAINGDGFFVVQNSSGTPYLTRAGSFVPDGEGNLVNAAGFYLMGYSFAAGPPSATANGFGGLEMVSIAQEELLAVPSTQGLFTANLPVDAAAVAAGPAAVGKRRRRHPHAENLARRLRQSRLRGDARHPLHQDRRQHLGSRGLQPGGRRARRALPLCRRLAPHHRDPHLRRHHRRADRAGRRHQHSGAQRRHLQPRHLEDDAARHGIHRAQGARRTATRHPASRASRSARTAPCTRSTRTAPSASSTASRSPTCRAPTC